MKAVIMAGGFGTRLRPLTTHIPKPLVPVGNVPIMEHTVRLLKRHGFTDLLVLLYFLPETITAHFGDGSRWGVRMSYATPTADLGTAGAVRFAAGELRRAVLVISGDVLTDFDLEAAVRSHRERRAEASIVLTRVDSPLAYGIVIIDESGRIVRFLEKPSWGEVFSDTINTGIYILEPSVLEAVPGGPALRLRPGALPGAPRLRPPPVRPRRGGVLARRRRPHRVPYRASRPPPGPGRRGDPRHTQPGPGPQRLGGGGRPRGLPRQALGAR